MLIRRLACRMFSALPGSTFYELYYQSGRTLGVRSYQVDGVEGRFFGPLEDRSVIRTHLQAGSWPESIISLLRNYIDNIMCSLLLAAPTMRATVGLIVGVR